MDRELDMDRGPGWFQNRNPVGDMEPIKNIPAVILGFYEDSK